jgi:outer membrane protein assembly factor BamD (BamD/ComL family)
VRVGKFYMQTGHYKGAYDRFKDAATFDHENVEAVFYLAQAAQKLNMQKEAAQNYQLYLAAVPDGPSAKAAKKALGELGSSSKP